MRAGFVAGFAGGALSALRTPYESGLLAPPQYFFDQGYLALLRVSGM